MAQSRPASASKKVHWPLGSCGAVPEVPGSSPAARRDAISRGLIGIDHPAWQHAPEWRHAQPAWTLKQRTRIPTVSIVRHAGASERRTEFVGAITKLKRRAA